MLGIKYLFAIILLFASVWDVATFVEYPSVNFNFSQPKKNAVITDANENLIFQKAKSKNRLLKINFTGATVNDGKMPEQKATPVAKRIKSEKNKFRTGKFSKTWKLVVAGILLQSLGPLRSGLPSRRKINFVEFYNVLQIKQHRRTQSGKLVWRNRIKKSLGKSGHRRMSEI